MRKNKIDTLYERSHKAAMCFCALWPIAIYFIAPWLLSNQIIGFLILIASIAQFLWLPDAIATWMTTGLENEDSEPNRNMPSIPTLPFADHARFDLKNGTTLWTRNWPRSAWVKGSEHMEALAASPEECEKYFAIQNYLTTLETVPVHSTTAVLGHLQYLFSLSVLNHRREQEFFREWPVQVIAERMVAYEKELLAKQGH
jgi:hypothetical protein